MTTLNKGNLRQLFADLAQCPCIWDGDPVPFQSSKGLCILSVSAVSEKGTDEYRSVYNPLTLANVEAQAGLRHVVLGVKIQAMGANASPTFEQLEVCRNRLRRKTVLTRLRADNIALVGVDPVADLSVSQDNAEIYASFMTVRLAYGMNDDRTIPAPPAYARATPAMPNALAAEDASWIQTVNGGTSPTVPQALPPSGLAISPASGTVNGGTAVTITGSGFTVASAMSATLGGFPLTGLVVVSPTQITAVTGRAAAPGVVDLVVTNEAGSGTGAALFTYV